MLILSALEISLTWLFVATALIGLGSLFLSPFARYFSLSDAFWMGLAAAVALLELWNLFLPLSLSITFLLFAAGILGLALNRPTLQNSLCTASQSSRALLLLGLAFTLLLALRSCGPCEYYDTGLYGAQAVRWIATYPAVPGLANLHGRLGYNSSVFLCTAALGHGPWKDLSFHLFTGFLLAAFWATLLPACARVIRSATNTLASPADWFHTILAVPAFFWTTRSRIVGTQTDEPAAIVALIATGILFEHFCQTHREDVSLSQRQTTARLILAATLFSLAVSFKVSTAVFALLAWLLVFRRIWQTTASPQTQRRSHLAAALLFSAALILPWLVRSIILSGYPLYPAAVFPLPVPWRIPLFAVTHDALAVQSWGRIPDGSFRDTRGLLWLGDWLHRAIRNRPSFQVPLVISVIALATSLICRFRSTKPQPACSWLILLLPSFASLAFWFAASPDLRFAQFAIWTAAATLGTWGVVSLGILSPDLPRRPALTRTVLAALALSIIWCVISFGWREPIVALRDVRQPPPLPKPALLTKHTLSGLAVNVPAQGNQCWDAPLPCTPYFDESLRLRDPSSMRHGFTSEARAPELHTLW